MKTIHLIFALLLVGCMPDSKEYPHKYHAGDQPCMKLGGRQVMVLGHYQYSDYLSVRQKDFSESTTIHEFELEPCK